MSNGMINHDSDNSLEEVRTDKFGHVMALTDNRLTVLTPLNYSFMKIANVKDVLAKFPRVTNKQKLREKCKNSYITYSTDTLNLSNNDLADLDQLFQVVSDLVFDPQKLAWVDLSRNKLTAIHQDLNRLTGLQILYLHSNDIRDFNQVNTLKSCLRLRTLTLHNNPLVEYKGYRAIVLSRLPQIQIFDTVFVHDSERQAVDFNISLLPSAKSPGRKM